MRGRRRQVLREERTTWRHDQANRTGGLAVAMVGAEMEAAMEVVTADCLGVAARRVAVEVTGEREVGVVV